MKIMVCGKGGCGKSTISALLAKTYACDIVLNYLRDCETETDS